MSKTWFSRRNHPAESQLGRGEEEGDRTERIKDRERNKYKNIAKIRIKGNSIGRC